MTEFKTISVPLPVVFLLAEFLFFSCFPLSDAYAVSRGNPWGAFTAFLIFDGWSNVIVIAFACLMTLISAVLLWPQSKLLLSSMLLVLTNAAGILANLVWLVSPYSAALVAVVGPHGIHTYPIAALGMSGATFGALGFSVTLSILAIAFQARNRPWNATETRVLWRLGMTGFGLLTLLGADLALSAFLPSEAELVHIIGLLSGLVGALSVGGRTLSVENNRFQMTSDAETLN